MGRATRYDRQADPQKCISIHALRGEGDFDTVALPLFINISIHALRGEGDKGKTAEAAQKTISIHALRGEGDSDYVL